MPMYINQLTLKNFRSYAKESYQFDPACNLFIGPNGSGKSNLLEALHFLATAKSYRAEALRELIKIGCNNTALEISLNDGTRLEAIIVLDAPESSRAKCVYKVNGVIKKRLDFLENYYAVFFSPADIRLVIGSPARRRSVLDSLLCQADPAYSKSCSVYEKALKQKNELLQNPQNPNSTKVQIVVWNKILATNGEYLQQKRNDFITFANNLLSSLYPKMEVSLKRLVLNYAVRHISQNVLNENLEREIALKRSLIGPHRDDFAFVKEGWDLGQYGSRGEQRTAVFALKLCELAYLENKVSCQATLLLDDIFSELDEFYREKVLNTISGRQSFITTAEENLIPKTLFNGAKIFRLEP